MSPEPAHAPAREDAPPSPAGSSVRSAIDIRQFGWIRPLAGEYAFHFERVADLYSGNPADPAAWRDAIGRAQRHGRPHADIAAVIAAQQARRGAPAPARHAAAKLADPRTTAVITGQQAGAFGGPLFTLLKAVTAIQLARRHAAEQQTEIIAIFWVDAEDHDWREVASCTVLDAAFQPRTVELQAPEGAGERPVAALTLDDHIEQAVDGLAAALQVTEFTPSVIEDLRKAYRPGTGMADAFARWLEGLLGPHGLVVFDSSDPAAKRFASDVFVRELRSPGRTAALAAEAGEKLSAAGHLPQVAPHPDSISLFHVDGGRRPIRRQGDHFVIEERRSDVHALLDQARSDPAHFSPNVLLRPIVQDTLFPTACYVAGPSELAYLGQLGGIYREFGVPMPLMYQRASATLVDSAAARFLNRYRVALADLQPQDESALNRLLESQLPESVEQAMREAHGAAQASMRRLMDALPALDPTLAGAAKTTLGKMEHDLKGLHNKIIHAAKKRHETLRRQFTRAQAQAFPLGQPQERTLAVVYFLNRYGPALVDRLLEDLPVEAGYHWVMTI
ncbi:MAG TPA: bacillithiol biosynthesis cysteine-adding enzyme BshC [Vicinamibacterales bacterium]|nr:bacillithiol biosynthesis cysteine-adding enzyme BshC [Vicinamibacterales bacterium]